jgi:hypothetical protein
MDPMNQALEVNALCNNCSRLTDQLFVKNRRILCDECAAEEQAQATCAACKVAIHGDQIRWQKIDAELGITLHQAGVTLSNLNTPTVASPSMIVAPEKVPAHIKLIITAEGIRVARCAYCAKRVPGYPAPNPGRSLDERIYVAKLTAPKPAAEPGPTGWTAWSTPHDEGP